MIIRPPRNASTSFLKKDTLLHRLIYYFFVSLSTVISFLFFECISHYVSSLMGIEPQMPGRLIEDKIGFFLGITVSVLPTLFLFIYLMKLSVWACKKLGL
jgi:hypothetical protein